MQQSGLAPYTTKESIFSMPLTTTNTPGTQNGLAHYFNPSSSVNHTTCLLQARYMLLWMQLMSEKLVMVQCQEHNTSSQNGPTLPTLTNYAPVIRYAEVLLNRAEAIGTCRRCMLHRVQLIF